MDPLDEEAADDLSGRLCQGCLASNEALGLVNAVEGRECAERLELEADDVR